MDDLQESKEHISKSSQPDGKIERFIEPCLLLLLAENPSHGYVLMENLEQFDINPRSQDPGQLYRTLRRLEKDGFVRSSWESGTTGPAKRCYEITGSGIDHLMAWMRNLTMRARMIEKVLARYEDIFYE